MKRTKNNSGKGLCDICGTATYLDVHHIRGRKISDPNAKSNLANICPICHKLVHMGDIIIEGWLMTTLGIKLAWHRKEEPSITGDDAVPHIIG